MPRCKPKSIVTYFTAAVVVSTLLLVCYNIMLVSPTYVLEVRERELSGLRAQQEFSRWRNRQSEEHGQWYSHSHISLEEEGDSIRTFPDQPRQKKIQSPSEALKNLKFSKTFRPLFNNLTRLSESKLSKRSLLSNKSKNNGNLNKNSHFRASTTEPHTIPHRECRDSICSGYLSKEDLARFLSCEKSVRNASATPYSGDCRFVDGEGRHPVALASLPGSGNTWVRGLLETATGMCTGAVYCDISLRVTGFTGEFVRSGSTLVVKTHENVPIWVGSRFPRYLSENHGRYGSAIFIIRNPFRALIAEWNRKVANNFRSRTISLDSHVKIVGQEWFGENGRWDSYVRSQAERWLTMIDRWIVNNRNHTVLVVKYEKLKSEPIPEVRRMLDFLGINYSAEYLQRRIDEGFSTFRRKYDNVKFEHFTSQQKSWVNSIIMNATDLLNDHNIILGDLIQLEDYFDSA